ncbi:MAG: glycosyltransferase family 39 protein [candidate division KSB1 bacterium]|nr:glycosyltransferase family 39 protein [candidate division KSB1 bacterium]MDZ7366478.1 glycosyltransferase family 39 protein [candidate division KSB1 bacterium]MDZ7404560.1 glycosyltransferase family 39 protein [candidate division KSB1 bacterium]
MNGSTAIAKLDAWPRGVVIGVIFGIGLAVRLLLILAMPQLGDPATMDAQNYLQLAKNVAASGSFSMWRKPSAYVAPGYPFFLAAIFKIGGENLLVVKLIQAVLGAATAALVYWLALHFGRPAMALLAALMAALHPELVGITAFIYTETFFIFLLTLSLLRLARAVSSGKASHFFLSGLLFGLTTLCRSTILYFPLFVLGAVLLAAQRWLWLRRWSFFILGMMLIMAPWTARNYYHFRVFLPVATGSGDVFWTGNYLQFDGEYRYQQTQAKLREIAGDVDLITRDRILMKDAWEKIQAEPAPHAWLFIRKIFRYWLRVYEDIPHGAARQANWLVFGGLAATHYALLLLAGVGIYRCNRQDHLTKLALLFVVYYTLIHAATLAVARYRMPLLPLLAIAAAAGLVWLLQKSSQKESSSMFERIEPGRIELDLPRERR